MLATGDEALDSGKNGSKENPDLSYSGPEESTGEPLHNAFYKQMRFVHDSLHQRYNADEGRHGRNAFVSLRLLLSKIM